MSRTRHLYLLIVVAIVLSLLSLFLVFYLQPSVGYIDSVQVYNEFQLKKELEGRISGVQKAKQRTLDSLVVELEMLKKENRLADFGRKKEYYLILEEKYQRENEQLVAEYQSQIWKQLNQYIKDYGRDESYDMIWGASGDGSLVYSESGKNLTEDVIRYVNDRYNDEKR